MCVQKEIAIDYSLTEIKTLELKLTESEIYRLYRLVLEHKHVDKGFQSLYDVVCDAIIDAQ